VLDSVRGGLLYANPGFYIANMVGNSMMLASAHPTAVRDIGWSMRQAVKAAHAEDTADPLWHQITIEMGRGPTSGGLSSRPRLLGEGEGLRATLRQRPPGTTGRVAETISHGLGNWGRRSGRVIDDAFRVAAWKAAARERGISTDEQIQKLFNDATASTRGMMEAGSKAKRTLNSIRDEAEQLMLDFDSMTPFEKTYLTRLIFLYPFLKASAKWPVMFAGERPVTAGVLGQALTQGELIAQQPEALGPRPATLPAWLDLAGRTPFGYLPIGSVAPTAAGYGIYQSLLGVGQPPEVGVQRPADYLNPFYGLLLDLAQGRTKFGQAKPAGEILRQEAPAPTWLRYWWKKPSASYADQDYFHTLLRSLRLPFKIDETAAAQSTSGR